MSSEIGELPIDPSRLGSAETVTVSIRPEHIQIVGGSEDAIQGRVVDAGFHGAFQGLLVAVAGVTAPAGEIRLHHFGTETFKVDQPAKSSTVEVQLQFEAHVPLSKVDVGQPNRVIH